MALSTKQKGVLIVIIMLLVLLMPVTYALIREFGFRKTEIKNTAPAPAANGDQK
jgi:flagellar basal body-associated protein FliL